MVAIGGLTGSAASVAVDHLSRRMLATGGAVLLAVSMSGFAGSPWLGGLLVASFLHGFASTIVMDVTAVALADTVGEERLRPFLARANLTGVAGDFAGPILLGVVVAAGWSWRVAFVVAAVLAAAYAVALALAPLPPPRGAGQVGHTLSSTLRAVLTDRQVWLIGVISLLVTPFDEPFLAFLLARGEELGATATGAAVIALVSVGGGVFAYGHLEIRLRNVRDRVLVAAGAAAAGVGSLLAGWAHGTVTLAAGGALVGVGLALAWLALEHRQLTLRPAQEGTTRAVIGSIEAVGFGIPVLFGWLIDSTSVAVGLAAHAALGAAVLVLAVRIR